MKARWLAVVSVALNVALAVAVAKAYRGRNPAPVAAESRGPVLTSDLPAPDAAVTSRTPVVETNFAAFRWSQVASQDFVEYRDRLLAMDCPRRTMRLIVESEINEKYGRQLQAALAFLQGRFWDMMADGPNKLESSAREATKEIREEREKVIEAVLGDEKADDSTNEARDDRRIENRRAAYAWLPEEKRDKLMALEDKLNNDRAELWRAFREKNPKPTKEQNADIQAQVNVLEKNVAWERKQILSPDEYEEYELRNSGAARWAANAAGFEPTEDEWRAVARLVKQKVEAEAELKSQKPATPDEKKARDAELKRLNDQLAEAQAAALGPERAALYERANNRDYQQVHEVTQRYGLDDAVAIQVYELQRQAMKQSDALRKNTSMDAAVRAETLAAIQQETERTLEQTMGAKAFSTYKKYDNGWFDRLGRQ